ncbi:nucleotidyl transferase AbiEii/AbiGii toxin family protein [Pseudopelagicola sp. nBUS_19]|uniref:nucleotidyl transferase AbiEii/AbiGii toxin family protein n=1 Tax=Pseudopelagicola sp. nBUS_19 TaxID=3395316 RepID=UPI003EB94B6D
MSRETQNFRNMVDSIVEGTDLAPLLPVVEKEILHYDILTALQKHGALKELVFQGDTSLRLIYGSNRFSEDLDFAGGPDFTGEDVEGVAEAISSHLVAKYGLSVNVKLPKEKPLQDGVNVSAWQISIETAPARPDLPRQRIKLEIANVTAQTVQAERLRLNYSGLPPSFGGLMLPVETLSEIMADKIVSLPAVTSHVRNRDVWDIGFISQKLPNFTPDVDMITKKIIEYGIEDFEEKLTARIESLPGIIQGEEFNREMQRFIAPSILETTLHSSGFRDFLIRTVSKVLEKSRDAIYGPEQSPDNQFKM